jgi:hypothetical protein
VEVFAVMVSSALSKTVDLQASSVVKRRASTLDKINEIVASPFTTHVRKAPIFGEEEECLPDIKPWYLSTWHFTYLQGYFTGDRTYEKNWLAVYSGYGENGGEESQPEDREPTEGSITSTTFYNLFVLTAQVMYTS